jgi:hypothetical protein
MSFTVRPGQTVAVPARWWTGKPDVSPRAVLTGVTLIIEDTDLPFAPNIELIAQPANFDFIVSWSRQQALQLKAGAEYFFSILATWPNGDALPLGPVPVQVI